MLATCLHCMRGTPYVYQGEEIGMTNAYFTDIAQYRDVESINFYHILKQQGKDEKEIYHILQERSRDNARTPMQWNDSANAGFSVLRRGSRSLITISISMFNKPLPIPIPCFITIRN